MLTKEYGSYFSIELPYGKEYYESNNNQKVAAFDCGRNAIATTALSINADRLYIPYYNCETVRDTLKLHNISLRKYMLDENLLPKIDNIGDRDWILVVNYFGMMTESTFQELIRKFKRVIFDNTQGFFASPVLSDDIFNIYSPRKFFGVSDGAYVVWNGKKLIRDDYIQDVSWPRSLFLLKSIEVGTNNAYEDNLKSMDEFGKEIKMMSKLSHRILSSIDYEVIKQKRKSNILTLHKLLKDANELEVNLEATSNMMIYPFLCKNEKLRRTLLENKIYVSQWWKYLLDIVPENSVEAYFSKWLFPLPIDQRYSEEDMYFIASVILENI